MQQITRLTPAELGNLATTPITVVAAPGAGNIANAFSMSIVTTGGSVDYNFGAGNIGIYYGNIAGISSGINGTIEDVVNTGGNMSTGTLDVGNGALGPFPNSDVADVPLVIAAAANPTLGNRNVTVTVNYTVDPVS